MVELLVAVTITLLLVVLLASIVSAALGAWNQGRNRLDTYSSARQALGRMDDELKGAVARQFTSTEQVQFVENSTLGAVPSPTPIAAENVFFAAPYPNLGAGDLCVIAYALDYTTHELKRAFKSSDTAWGVGPGKKYQAAGYTFQTSDWHVVATGVLELELQSYSQANLDNDQPPVVSWDSESSDVNITGKTPRRIVMRLKVVDDRTLVKLAGMTPGSATYDQLVLQGARQFLLDLSLTPP